MYKNKTILALITARGGSKGILNKNIKPLSGVPLIEWTINEAKKSQFIDRLILSSESEEIINVAKNSGCDIPFIRPSELAQDDSSSMDVILHALNNITEVYDYLLLLQPTSPFRQSWHIDNIIKEIIDNKAKSIVSVTQSKKHPAYMYELSESSMRPVLKNYAQKRRQDMPIVYEHNGALYISEVEYLKKEKSYNTNETRAYIMEDRFSIDIDTTQDWEFAEYLISKGLI